MDIKNKLKRKLMMVLMMSLFLVLMVACNREGKDAADGNSKKVVTVTTSFLYDMVHQLSGDSTDIELLIPAGEDPHLYVTKPQDLKKIACGFI